MKKFRVISEDETERVNRLQAEYFSRTKHIFDPPYPEGVPERLERIVTSAVISYKDTVVDIGTGTGVLVPLIQKFSPAVLYANDICKSMLDSVKNRYPEVKTLHGGIRKLNLNDDSVDKFFVNACYPNLIDKHRCFLNIGRMLRPGGKVVISHPLGRKFTEFLKEKMPFPVDDFPCSYSEADELFRPYGFEILTLVDEQQFYLLIITLPDRSLTPDKLMENSC